MKKRVLCCLLMLCMVITMAPAMAWAGEGEDGVILNIANGSITITDTGYKQGTADKVSWGDNTDHELTIIGNYTNSDNNTNNFYIDVVSGTPKITIKDLTIVQSTKNLVANGIPGLVLRENQTATLILEGENTLSGGNSAPGVQINGGATLTIEGTGSLTAKGTNFCPGIGAPRLNTCATTMSGGNLIIESGIINAGTYSGSHGAIGGSLLGDFGDITIKGGNVTAIASGSGICTDKRSSTGVAGGKITISGGKVSAQSSAGVAFKANAGFKMTGGTLIDLSVPYGGEYFSVGESSNISITGGNVNGYYTGGVDGRDLAKLYFTDEDGTALADTEVTVTDDAETWNAFTDKNGVITTYLAEATTAITAEIDGTVAENCTVQRRNGQKVALIGTKCICDSNTDIQWSGVDAATIYKGMGELTVAEEPQFIKAANCVAPVHPEYDILKVTIEEVTVEGAAVETGKIAEYATYSDGNLTLKEKTKDYTVTLKAASENDEITSSYDIAVTVDGTVTGLDIANGNITVTDAGNGQVTYTQGGLPLTVDASEEVVITGTAESNKDGNTILVDNCSPTIRLKDVTVKFTTDSTTGKIGAYYSAIKIAGDSHATIVLEGTNKLFEANRSYINRGINGIELNSIDKDKPAKITIKCDEENEGSECSDDNCPHKLYVYSEISPGIGYGAATKDLNYVTDKNSEKIEVIHYFEVNIEGGQVIGDAISYTAVIGGGWNQQIGFGYNMTGGYVYAERPGTESPLIGFGRATISSDSYVNLNVTGGKIETKIPEIGGNNAGYPTISTNSVNIGGDAAVDVQGGISGNVALEGNADLSITAIPGEVDKGSYKVTSPGNITGSLTVTGDAAANLEGCVTKEANISGSGASLSVGKDGGQVNIENGATVTLPSGDAVTFPETIGSVTIPAGKLSKVEIKEDGSTSLPEGSKIADTDENNITLPSGGSVSAEGAVKTEGVKITEDAEGTVTVAKPNGETTTITPSEDGNITVDSEGNITVPAGSTVNGVEIPTGIGTVTLPADKVDQVETTEDGAVNLPEGTVITKDDGTTIKPSGEGEVTVEPDGTVKAPAGTTVTDKDGNKTTLPSGGSVSDEGAVTTEGVKITEDAEGTVTVEKDGETTTITPSENVDITVSEDGSITATGEVTVTKGGETTTITPSENVDITVSEDGTITATGEVTVTKGDNATTTTPSEGGNVTVDSEGTITVPEGTVITKGEGDEKTTITLPSGGSVSAERAVTTDGVKITEDAEGTVTVAKPNENPITITPPTEGGEIAVGPDGSITAPQGTVITKGEGENQTTATLPTGTGDVTLPADKVDQVETTEDGSVNLPAGSVITKEDGTNITSSENAGITVSGNGSITATGEVTVTKGDETTTITPSEDGEVTVGTDGKITVPEGTVITKGEGDEKTTTTLPSGGSVDADGTVSSETGAVITENPNGTVTVEKDGETTTIKPSGDEKVTVGTDGNITVPEGTTVTDNAGNKTTLPSGGSVDSDGTASSDTGTVITENVNGTVTVTKPDEAPITIAPPTTGEEITVKPDGSITVPEGSTFNDVEIPAGTGDVTLPADKADQVSASNDGSVDLPAGSVITKGEGENQTTTTLPSGGSVSTDGTPSSSTGNVITENTDGTVTVIDKNGNTNTINPPEGSKVEIEEDGTVKIPAGSEVTDKDGNTNTMGNGGTITEGGTVNENPSSGGGIYIPTEKPATDPIQSGNTTTTDMSGSTVSKGGQTTTIVDKKVADKLAETAVKNNSEEIVINAVTKNQSAASSTKASEVTIPVDTLQTIAEKTNANITIKTNVAEVKLDNKAAEAVASQAQTGTVTIVAEKVKEDANEVHFELEVVASNGEVISDFNGGNASVTVNVPDSLKGKKMVCVYIDGNGNWHKIPGELNANGTYTFTTEHFSTYAIMSEEEADAAIAEQQAKIKKIIKGVEATTLKARSSKTSKGIKITWTKSKGYKVDYYVIYRSTKKNSGYGTKPFYTTKSATAGYYVNSKDLKKGTKYYYKVRGVRVIDGQKYYTEYSTKASRTW